MFHYSHISAISTICFIIHILALFLLYVSLFAYKHYFYYMFHYSRISAISTILATAVGGIMIWELGQDRFDDYSLLETIHKAYAEIEVTTSSCYP